MAAKQAPSRDPDDRARPATSTPVVRPIVKATDLGSVQVLKQGNLYLLTDPFGDVHPDGRGLGLYDGDTRRLSCSILRVDGQRPVLLQAVGGRQLPRHDPAHEPAHSSATRATRCAREEALETQKLGDRRGTASLTGDALEERVRIVNYAEAPRTSSWSWSSRRTRPTSSRSAAGPARSAAACCRSRCGRDRVTFRYDGLDGTRMATHVAFTEPAADAGRRWIPTSADSRNAGWVRLAWTWRLALGRGARARLGGRTSSGRSHAAGAAADVGPRRRPPDADAEPTTSCSRRRRDVSTDVVAASYHAWSRGIAEIRTDNELFNLAIDRSASDLRLLLNDGPGPGERYLAAGVPWFTTLFGRDAIIASLQALAIRPQLAVETLEVLARLQATDEDPARDAEPGKILHELRTGEMARDRRDPAPAVLRLGRRDAAVADPAGRHVRLDRRPRPRRPAVAQRPARRSSGSTATATATATASSSTAGGPTGGLLNQGWKDSHDAIRDRRRGARRGARSRWPRSRATCSTPSGGWPPWPASAARPSWRARLDAEAETLRRRFEDAFWIEDHRLLRDGPRRRQAPGGRDRLERRPCLWSRDRVAGSRAGLVAPAAWPRTCSPAGASGPTPRASPATTRSATTRARSGPTTCRSSRPGSSATATTRTANRLVGRVFEASQHFADFRLPELFCGFDRDLSPVPGPVPRRLLAAGLGRRLHVPVPARRCSGCGRTPTATSWSSPARSCPTG